MEEANLGAIIPKGQRSLGTYPPSATLKEPYFPYFSALTQEQAEAAHTHKKASIWRSGSTYKNGKC